MTKRIFKAIVTLAAVIVLLLSAACTDMTVTPSPTAGTTAQPEISPTAAPEIAGQKQDGGMVDISQPIKAAAGGQTVRSCVYSGRNTLLALVCGEADFIMKYDTITGSASARYELPFMYSDAESYCSLGIIQPLSDGGVMICDTVNNRVIRLDAQLKQTSVIEGILPEFSSGAYGCMRLKYMEKQDAFIYAYRYSKSAGVYRLSMDGKSTELFTTGGYEDYIALMNFTEDEKYINIDVTGQQTESGHDDTLHRSYTLDTKTGEIINTTWLYSAQYSEQGISAKSSYYAAISDLTVNGVKLDIKHMKEYDCVAFDAARGRAVTAAGNDSGDSFMLFSAYDLNTGKLSGRTVIRRQGYKPLTYNDFDGSAISVDRESGAVCFTAVDSFTDIDTTYRTVIWQPENAGMDEVSKDESMLLRPARNAPYSEGAETELQQEIENDFNIKVYYGKSFREYLEKYDFGTTTVTTFGDDADPQYIFECMTALKQALSEYPKSMLDKISSTDDGPLTLFLCTYVSDSVSEFNIVGQYKPMHGTQNILLNFSGSSADDFATYGSTGAFISMTHHELCHAMQWYFFMLANSKNRPAEGVFYDYNEWCGYYPEDLEFNSAETDKYVNGTPEERYFIDSYSTYAISEDMSRMFEHAMWEPVPKELNLPLIKPRAEYLMRIIRTAFNDGTWPEQMKWERFMTSEG